MTVRLWSRAERDWGRECLRSGDSVEEIAEMAGCDRAEVVGNLGVGRLNPRQREIVSLYTAGASFPEINAELGYRSRCAESIITDLRSGGYPLAYRREVAQ